jgi:hypothetical protein
MKRFLNGLRNRESIEHIIESLYWLTYFNAKDFLLAGQSLELSLVSLDSGKGREAHAPDAAPGAVAKNSAQTKDRP